MTVANYVTLTRIIFIPLTIGLLLADLSGLALVVFLLLSFSDAIDGYIARRFNQVSDLGKYLDPLADKILVISALIAEVGLQKASPVPVMIIVARELIVQALRIQVAKDNIIIAASRLAKLKTTLQIIAAAMLMLALPLADWVLWLAVIISLVSGGDYFWQSKILKVSKSN